jgi:hypothetical protein
MIAECVERINVRRHTRFGVSRRERVETLERAALKALPTQDFDCGEWRTAKLHPNCYVMVEAVLYSAPHIHRHKKLRIKLTDSHVEIFLDLERLAIHPRGRHRDGRRIKIDADFPPNSQAYYETTPQRFAHPVPIHPSRTPPANWPISASSLPSPPCADTTSSACRTSMPCSLKPVSTLFNHSASV